uniref:Tripartite motif-containing protein 45 n=1 Tax=Magallana gigas TaxID=29159 RepID=K1RM57_MAGGI
MATSETKERDFTPDVSLCSICLEQYKSPVSLHCSHSFCQTCLSTHIKSSCGDCDTPLGFPCPLCRVFIPAPGEIGQYSVDKWATKFPENKFLKSVVGVPEILCKPCQEDGEEVKANSWCKDCSEALCEECTKCHKKYRPSRKHIVISITEWSGISQIPDTLEICQTHGGRKFELFCRKHFLPCCSVCVIKEHSCCTSFCELEEIGRDFIEPEKVKALQSGINKFGTKLKSVIGEKRTNMKRNDDIVDTFTKELLEFTTNIMQVVKKLEEEHLNEISRLSKESNSKLQKSVESFEQRFLYLEYWKEILLKNLSNETTSETKKVLSYIKLKNIHANLQRLKCTKLEICIKTKILDDVKKLIKLPCLADVSADEIVDQVSLNMENIDYTRAKGNKISEFTIAGTFIMGVSFLGNGNLFLADHRGKRCILCDINGVILQEAKILGSPWGVCTSGMDILMTLPNEKSILKFDSTSFETIETVPVDCHGYGIAASGNTIVIGTDRSVDIKTDGFLTTKRKTLLSGLSSMSDVAIDNENNVICSTYVEHNVRKLDLTGKVLFTYNHEKLRSPYRLTTDSKGNIFVYSAGSSNIHILSRDGKLLQIIEGVTRVSCLKFQDATNRLFVGSSKGSVTVFEFSES